MRKHGAAMADNKENFDKNRTTYTTMKDGVKVTNSTEPGQKQAVALSYEPGTEAPVIVAAGKGYLADKIINTAKENDVPLYADDKLADTLMRLQIGDSIPPELYKVVADILVFVDSMDKIKSKIQKEGRTWRRT